MLAYYKFRRKIKNYFLTKKIPKLNNFDFENENEELFLFGNGYTLDANINLNNLSGADVFVCNEFHRHPEYKNIIEQNNVLYFALDGIGSYEKIIPKREDLSVGESFEKYLHPILRSGVNIVVPFNVFSYVLRGFPKTKMKSHLLLFEELSKTKGIEFEDIVSLSNGHTPQGMILVGILMGYKKIHLHGLEHNYVKDILNKDPKCGTHFYGESYRQVLELNHGTGLPREAYKVTLSKLFEGNAKVFKAYEQLAELAKELNVEVIDHSKGSLFMFQDYSLWDLVETKRINR
jgi:hypothetical protein